MQHNSLISPIEFYVEKVHGVQTNARLVSEQSPFGMFNLAYHVNDKPDHVKENRTKLLESFSSCQSIQWLEQVHGNNVVTVDDLLSPLPKADAMATRLPGIALAIMTADCLPILLCNKEGTEIGAIHAGWRPLAANIIDNTLTTMDSCSNQVVAWLGPCISQKHFEVGQEVFDVFFNIDKELEQYFVQTRASKYHGDIGGIARHLLIKRGVEILNDTQPCTFSNAKYYSYRRNQTTGRMASLISILP